MRERITKLCMALCLVLAAFFVAPASADAAETINLSTVSSNGNGYTYTYQWTTRARVVTITEPGDYILTQNGSEAIERNVIIDVPKSEGEVNLTLQNINLKAGDYTRASKFVSADTTATAAISIEGNTVCNMILSGTNTVEGTDYYESSRGQFNTLLQTAAIYVENTYINNRARLASLTIKGTGSLEASGDYQAAGIGGNCNRLSGNITIESGNIVAKGGQWAPGIGDGDTFMLDVIYWNCTNQVLTTGAGRRVSQNCQPSTIEIKGGNVTAIAQRGTSAIGASDELCGESGVTLNGEWDGMIVKLTGGTILAVGSYNTDQVPEPSAGIGTGSNTILNPANLIIKDTNNLKLLVLSCVSTSDNEGTFPITVNQDSLPSMSADSNVALVNVYGVNGGTRPVAAGNVSVSKTVNRILNDTEMSQSVSAISEFQTMLNNFVASHEHTIERVVGLAVNLPLENKGMYVDDEGNKFYPSKISLTPTEISVFENEKEVSYTATVTRDERDTQSGVTSTYSYTWQVSTDGGANWSDITSGRDGYTITEDGNTSKLYISQQGVTEEKDGNLYRCGATIRTEDYTQIITSNNGLFNVNAAYYDVTVNLKLGEANAALPLETLVGTGKALYLVDNSGALTKLVGTNGSYAAKAANNKEYTIKVGPADATQASQLSKFYEDIKVEVSDAPVVRDLKFYSVTYTDGVNGAAFADEVEYYFNSHKVTVSDKPRTRTGYDFKGYTENGKTYQYGEKFTDTAGGEITKNHVLTASWAEQYGLTVTINADDTHRTTEESFPSTVKIRLTSRAEGTTDEFTPTTDLTVYEIEMKEVAGETKKYTGSKIFSNLPSGYEYGFVIFDDSNANYQETWEVNWGNKQAQTVTDNLVYIAQYENLTFAADASALPEGSRPTAINVNILQSSDSDEWNNVLETGDNQAARAIILGEDGKATATIGVPTFGLGAGDQIDTTKPYYYRIQVVSYTMADGTEIPVDSETDLYTETYSAPESDKTIGSHPCAYYKWENDAAVQTGTPTVTLSGDLPDLSYQANLEGAQGVPANKRNVLKITADDLPEITGPEGSKDIFMGWYTDADCTNEAVAGTYLKEDTTLYGKWVAFQNLEASVKVNYTHDGHMIPEDVRSKQVTVILQAAYATAPNAWGAVASKKDVPLTASADGKSASADVVFEDQRLTDRDGTEILYRIVVTEPEYTTVYMNAKTDGQSASDPTAGYYHAVLNFDPTMEDLYYQLDVSSLSDAAKTEIGTLKGILLYSPNKDGSGGSDSYWGSSFTGYDGATTAPSFNVKGAGNYVGGTTKVWTTIHNSQPIYFQMKLVDANGNLLEPVGYTITRSEPVSYDRNYVANDTTKGEWIGGEAYEGTGENAITLKLEPKLYNLEYNLGYDAYPDTAQPAIWVESPIKARAYGVGMTAAEITANDPPARIGYTFDKWVEVDADGNESPVSEIPALDTNTHTYLAKWTKNGGAVDPVDPSVETVTLSYDTNGGSKIADKKVVKNTTVDLSGTTPRREGYTFTGWYSDEDLTTPITKIKMTSDKTVYAGWAITGIPGMLNGTDHFAYVKGYPNGLVMPQGNITRAEVATIFFRLLNDDVREENLSKSNSFTDTKKDAWYNTAVSTLSDMGILRGYEDGSFCPNANITRAEFAAIASRFDESDVENLSTFTDIDGHWAENDISHAATLGWISGYPDGTFGPNKAITRAETMSLVNRVLKRLPEKESDLLSTMTVWPDCASSAWYYLAVQEATNSHNYERKQDGVHEKWSSLRQSPDWSKYE